jgi:peptide deformylase
MEFETQNEGTWYDPNNRPMPTDAGKTEAVGKIPYFKKLVPKDDSLLRERMPDYDFANPSISPVELADTLAQNLLLYGGAGLAANQIGIKARAFTIKANPILVCINPRIVDFSQKEEMLEEGCLTFPGLYVKIKRPLSIKVRFQYPNGETVTETYTGLTARVFQHELDHLNGILFTQRANKIHLEQARNKARRNKKHHGNI